MNAALTKCRAFDKRHQKKKKKKKKKNAQEKSTSLLTRSVQPFISLMLRYCISVT